MIKKETGASRYYTAQIKAPRLTGKTAEEVEKMAKHNAALLDNIIEKYLEDPCEVLFIKDVSIYLQAGEFHKLFSLNN